MIKLRNFAPLFLVMFLTTVLVLPVGKTAKADDEILHVDVHKTVTNVSCVTNGETTTTEIQGTYEIKNESAVPVILARVREWVSMFPFEDQPIEGSYALTISDGAGFVSPMMVYDVTATGVPLQNLNYSAIGAGETAFLGYTLEYQGQLPSELYNSVDFSIAGVCDPYCETEELFHGRIMFAGVSLCQMVTPETQISATQSPEVLAEVEELPETGSNLAWLYGLIISSVLALAFSIRFLQKRSN